MTWQRRKNGQPIHVWEETLQVDKRGNSVKVPVRRNTPVQAWIIPERSAKAEVPGQQHINIFTLGIAEADAEGIGLWSRVDVFGKEWDVVTPPGYHYGTPTVRHYTLSIRERPS